MFYGIWLAEVILLNNGIVLFENAYFMIGSLFCVGICGGGCYVNVMYCIMSHPRLAFYERELAINICTILDDIGIICASLTSLLMSNVIYPNKH
jgi:hypothetical protein